MNTVRALAVVLAMAMVVGAAAAQSTGDAQRKLEAAKRELRSVSGERKQLQGKRRVAATDLQALDARVARSQRTLAATDARLRQQEVETDRLQTRRDALATTLAAQRTELQGLLRAAYRVRADNTPLKVLLAQDQISSAQRTLRYHRSLQASRGRRIVQLQTELAELQRTEQALAQAKQRLDGEKRLQRTQLAQLDKDRRDRAAIVAQLDDQVGDARAREQAIGRDVRGLEQLLARLRAQAAQVERDRRAAAARAERERQANLAAQRRADVAQQQAEQKARAAGQPPPPRPPAPPPPKPAVAMATPVAVGGMGWPVNGTLLAGFGGNLPEGGRSNGLLIAAPAGTQVRAVAAGSVVYSAWMNGYGLIVIVDHGAGVMSLYARNDAVLKDVGARVERGTPLASVGNSGGGGQPALYFELRRGGTPVDPRSFLRQ